jgi:hypothetical protein
MAQDRRLPFRWVSRRVGIRPPAQIPICPAVGRVVDFRRDGAYRGAVRCRRGEPTGQQHCSGDRPPRPEGRHSGQSDRHDQSARGDGVLRIFFLSSGGTVYGIPETLPIPETHPLRPINSYGIVKATIEQYLRMYRLTRGFSPIIVRASNPYGPRQAPRSATWPNCAPTPGQATGKAYTMREAARDCQSTRSSTPFGR